MHAPCTVPAWVYVNKTRSMKYTFMIRVALNTIIKNNYFGAVSYLYTVLCIILSYLLLTNTIACFLVSVQ